MKVWVEKNRTPAVCALEGCMDTVEEGKAVVRIKLNQQVTNFHPQCWLRMAEDWAEEYDSTAPRRGRKPLALSEEERQERTSLLRLYAANRQRIRQYEERLNSGEENRSLALRIIRLHIIQEVLRRKADNLGGAPSKWGEMVSVG